LDKLRGLRELSLFTGAGGGVLASKLLGWEKVGYVEKEDYCRDVLRARIAGGILDDAPVLEDVRDIDGNDWQGKVDIVSAGFPCQPFSLAGQRKGAADDRNMWPDTVRIIRQIRPRFAFLENVPGLLSGSHGYFGTVLGDLAESGYDAVWDCIQASAVGAPHRRNRLWILAYPNDLGGPGSGLFGDG
jgi:DNA (cytosine-5)-methyltransferase 1